MIRKLVLLLVVGALFLVVDSVARAYAVEGMQEKLTSKLKLANDSGSPRVTIGGFPFLTQALVGEFSSISISAERTAGGNLGLSDVQLTLRAVELSTIDAVRGKLDHVRIGSARGTGELAIDQIATVLSRPGSTVPKVYGGATIEGNELVYGPITHELPTIGDEIVYERAEVLEKVIRVHFRLPAGRLTL